MSLISRQFVKLVAHVLVLGLIGVAIYILYRFVGDIAYYALLLVAAIYPTIVRNVIRSFVDEVF